MTLSSDFWPWVEAHADDDTARLRLKYGRDRALEILQIECRRKYRAKLGGLFGRLSRFTVPNALAPEQSTSWPLASYHASLIAPGARVADLTAGMGVDVLAFSDVAVSVTAIERDPDIAEADEVNFAAIPNIKVVCADCADFIRDAIARGERYDCLFIDPARRAADGSRLFALNQCSPDAAALMPDMLRVAPKVIVKASPMLDVTHTLRELPQAAAIIITGTTTECKELIAVCSTAPAPAPGSLPVSAVTVADGGASLTTFTFTRDEEAAAQCEFGIPAPGWYVYDPYPAVMKAAPYGLLGSRFGLMRPARNTQLWTGPELRTDFPGHIFKVTDMQPFASRVIKRYAAAYPEVSVTTRNFDMDAATLRRKLRVRDGSGALRLFAVTDSRGEKYLVTAGPLS